MNRQHHSEAMASMLKLTGLWITITLLGLSPTQAAAQQDTLRIGTIGTGSIGGTLARYWAQAGHELVVSSRHPEELEDLADELGPRVRTGLPAEAAEFGEVVLVSVPYAAMPQIGRDFSSALAGKVVIDTGNPIESRDGPMAAEALAKGSGIASAEFLPGARLVRAFNAISAANLRARSDRRPEPVAIPLAGDDAEALATAARLVRDAGFAPVIVGPLNRAGDFDLGRPLARDDMTAAELAHAAEVLPSCWFPSIALRFCMWLD